MECMGENAALPNLVNATGVETLLRLPSSARFDEFPVHGKSFPLRKTISCSLQVEFCTDRRVASGKCMEAMATVLCKRGNTCASDAQTRVSSCLIEREGKVLEEAGGFCLSVVCRRGGNDCEQQSLLQHQLKSSLITQHRSTGVISIISLRRASPLYLLGQWGICQCLLKMLKKNMLFWPLKTHLGLKR